MIYFTNFSKMKKYPNMKFFSISENIPKGINIPIINELIPIPTLTFSYKKEQINEDVFRKNYFSQLRLVNRLKLGNLLQENCIVSDRPLNVFSHAKLVVEWFESVGFEVKELK